MKIYKKFYPKGVITIPLKWSEEKTLKFLTFISINKSKMSDAICAGKPELFTDAENKN
jgi:hypothetical protein